MNLFFVNKFASDARFYFWLLIDVILFTNFCELSTHYLEYNFKKCHGHNMYIISKIKITDIFHNSTFPVL